MRISTGVVTDDPAASAPIGSELRLSAEMFPVDSLPGEHHVVDWDYFGGVLLQLKFIGQNKVYVHGSAVLVAPGVALAARHVIEPFYKFLLEGSVTLVCSGISPSQLMLWKCKSFTYASDKSDIVIISLSYCSPLPPDNTFKMATISTRLPSVGEPLTMVGFTASELEFDRQDMKIPVSGDVRISVGTVTASYPHGRDSVLMPGPTLEVASSASGGMSGGPVFDRDGFLVGLISTSFGAGDHVGPAYTSLLWPALIVPIGEIWPSGLNFEGRTLLQFGKLCAIDRRDAIQQVSDTQFRYTPWEKE